MSSFQKLDELLNLRDDAKHPDLSKLLKCSAEFQSELAKESTKQSRNHLYISIAALIIAGFSVVWSVCISLDEFPSWTPSKTKEPPHQGDNPTQSIKTPSEPVSPAHSEKINGGGTKEDEGKPNPAASPKQKPK